MTFLEEIRSFRVTKEVKNKCDELIKSFPEDYRTGSDVIRAGVMRLYHWKMENLINPKNIKNR